MDKILKAIIKLQIPFLIGGTVTGAIMTYYHGFLFTIIVNSIIWWGISYAVNRFLWKSSGLNDQRYLIRYFLLKMKRVEKRSI